MRARILVAGATGSLGGRIASGLLKGGEAVRVLARPNAATGALREQGAEVVTGNLKEPASLAAACAGMEVVITTVTAAKRGDDSLEKVDLEGSRNLIEAARAARVRHFVYVSTLGASPASPMPLMRIKGLTEQTLKTSGLTYTILEPGPFMDVWFPLLIEMPVLSVQPVTLVGESRGRHSFVAERDVAAFAVAAVVGNPAARNATIAIGGPAALTFRDVVKAYEDALGRPIALRSVAPGEPIPGVPPDIAQIATALESFDAVVPMEETARRFGVTLTSAADFARSRLAAVPAH